MKISSFARYRFVSILVAIVAVLIVLQMIRIQTSAAATELGKMGEQNAYELRRVYPERGSIYDRWGHMLAGNEEVYEVAVDLRYSQGNGQTIAATLNSILGLDYTSTLNQIDKEYVAGKSEYIVLDDFVTADKIEQLAQIKDKYSGQSGGSSGKAPSLEGLTWTPHLMRSYPEKTLASNILGFYMFRDRNNGQGYYGVEEKYNDILAGTPQDILVPKDPYQMKELPNVPPGSSLILTIDREIQSMTEKVLDNAVKENEAESGTIIVSDPKTGEILSIATTPRLDPNQYWTKYGELFPDNTPFNRAVSQTYEPGSVFKVLTMASALDAGAVTPTTPFLDTGVIEVGGYPIYNWDRGAWGPQDMVGCMQHSLNVCLAWVATQLGPTRFYDYMQRFGIGHRTNIDLGEEVLWPLALPGDSNWYPVNLGTNAFGQGLAVTPIQMVMAVDALANDGKMMAPHVLKAVIDNDRQYNNNPQVVGQPISAKAARTITDMLVTSLEQEASTALVPGYSVAGKTGTGEIPTPDGYTLDVTNASFVGWGPADDPRFVIYVWLEKPKTSIWGSIVAAPVFSEVAQKLVVLMNIPPDAKRLELTGK